MNLKLILLTAVVAQCYPQEVQKKKEFSLVGSPLAFFKPCKGNDDVTLSFESGRPPDEENQYNVNIKWDLPAHSKVTVKFDSEATINLYKEVNARVSTNSDSFLIIFYKSSTYLGFNVKGPASGAIPYITSIVVNTVEFCENPQTGYLDSFIIGTKSSGTITLTTPDDTCGRRKVEHTELIVSGQPTKPGDWPWHVALYRLDGVNLKYICGGTLVSKTVVVTAAHCVTFRGAPILAQTLNVVLGKYNLVGGDISAEEREVHQIIVHDEFDHRLLNNDIALLKLKSEAQINDYVQPACLWHKGAYKKLPNGQVYGTVVGWGFDQSDVLSRQLQQAKMPKISESKCLKSNPVFFSRMLTSQKFCAGYTNGTSACNGDSGGGFFIFVPDSSGDSSSNGTGSYHIRGIVSSSVSRHDAPICDPSHYVLFTDVAKFRGWIEKYMT